MCIEGVLISFKVNQNLYYSSGISLNSDLVLVPGNVLLPFTQEEKWVSSFSKKISTEIKFNVNTNNILFRVLFEPKSDDRGGHQNLNFVEFRVAGVWKCPAVSESVKKLFSEWILGQINSKNESGIPSAVDPGLSKELMSVIVLLRRENGLVQCNKSYDGQALVNLMPSLEEPSRGQRVEILSTPFGNEHLLNSLSHGIISNVIGTDKCIILSDARTAPGCEGGPIFAARKPSEKKSKLIGMVICSISWWRNEWIGLTLGISLTPFFKALVKDSRKVTSYFRNKLSSNNSDLLPLDLVDETVVLVRSKTCWGSGILLSSTSGVIITCSHVVKNDKKVSVLYKAKLWPASVIFKSREGIAYDLAVLKTEENFIFQKEIEFSECPAEIGNAVFAAGYPFFSEIDDWNIKPTVVNGSVAKVNPYMIQTTCCIQSGFSGGAVFKNEKLLGIIVSNARDSTTGASFPHINFVIPSSVFQNPVLKYIRQDDVRNLKELECSSSRVQLLWQLQSSKL